MINYIVYAAGISLIAWFVVCMIEIVYREVANRRYVRVVLEKKGAEFDRLIVEAKALNKDLQLERIAQIERKHLH